MRPYHESEVERVRDITRPYLATHGEPVDWGWDAVKRLGIRNIHDPDFGEKIEFKDGEVPVFWVCKICFLFKFFDEVYVIMLTRDDG